MITNAHTGIKGQRITLIPYRKQHVEIYHEWMKDPFLQEMTSSEPLSLAEEYEMQQSWLIDPLKCTFIIHLASFDKNQYSIIGDVNIYFNQENQRGGEIEIMIAESDCRHRGLGREALQLMIYYGVSQLKMNSFTAKISLKNQASLKLFKSLGFLAVGTSEYFQQVEMVLNVNESNYPFPIAAEIVEIP
jgi:RimJ/RimL family protein N-acetyltransferase